MKDTWGREVMVETIYYENFTGCYPYGRGEWAFHFGGYAYEEQLPVEFIFYGTYSQTKIAAIREAAKHGYNLVTLLA